MYADRSELFQRKNKVVILDAVDTEQVGDWSTESYQRVDAALQDASDVMDSYIGQRYTLPIQPTPRYLKKICCDIAFYNCMAIRGFASGTADDTIVRDRDEAIKWLRQVSEAKAAIPADDGTPMPPTTGEGGTVKADAQPEIHSNPKIFGRGKLKGW